MFRFEHPQYLYVLEVIPVLVAFFVLAYRARKRLIAKFGNMRLMGELMPQVSRYKDGLKFVLLVLALAFLIVGAANPQWGVKREKTTRKGVDVFIALDVSNSMLAEDVQPNRLERAKQFAEDLMESLRGERLGFIIFAGNAYLQVPLTTDYGAMQLFIKSANPTMVPTQGTAIGDAISLAVRSADNNNKKNQAIIIISDGENHDVEASAIAKKANEDGLLVFTVVVGTKNGSFIPEIVGGRQDVKRDQTGNPVRTKADPDALRELAKMGQGGFFDLGTDMEMIKQAITMQIERMEKREFEQRAFSEYESYFQYFLGAALLLIVIEFLISYSKNKYLGDRDLFKI
ncbi:MAG: VWA domain-containing protein [Saprospiraceae bacterium]